jgi:hypothetical protein
MKWHLGLLIFFSANFVLAESPPCIGSNILEWGNCRGSHIYPNGDKYVGGFVGGKFSGFGQLVSKNGDSYTGDWFENMPHGLGKATFADGRVPAEGKWVNGRFSQSQAINLALSKIPLVEQLSVTNQTGSLTALQPGNSERERLLAEVEAERKKRQELEEQLKVAQQTSQPSQSITAYSLLPITTNRRALVIGNDTYKSVPKLANAREDARTIASNLTSSGYQVTLKLDVTEKEMKAALRTFAGQVQGGDEVLFFFAGHGVQLGATNYLLPTDIVGDSEAQVKDEAIQLQRVLDDMSEKKAKFTLAMVDACRDNPFKSTGRAIGGRGLAPTTAATGQMVIFSAGTGQQALDKLNSSDKNKNGLFTRVFAQEMQKPNLTIDRVVKNVRNQVAQLAKSVGHEQVPAIYDQVLGDFYFKVLAVQGIENGKALDITSPNQNNKSSLESPIVLINCKLGNQPAVKTSRDKCKIINGVEIQ